MLIPVRAVYSRSPRGKSEGFVPQMVEATYADVPEGLVLGAMAQSAKACALYAGDDEAAAIIDRAMDKAAAAGDVIRME